MPGCRTTKSPRRPGWPAVRSEPRWRERAEDWSKLMTQDWKEDSMSHVDEGTLHAYLDGELPSVERAALEAHLADCATCRDNLTEERALRERASAVLGSARPAERPAPPLERLRREPKRSPWRVRRSFAWAASIALALGVGYFMRSPGRMAPTPETPAQPVAVAQNHAAATEARVQSQHRSTNRRATRLADEADTAATKVAAAPLSRPADSVRIDASVVSGAVARAERDAPTAPAPAPAPTHALGAGAPSIVANRAPARQLTTTTWPVINRRVARSILGEEPVGLPGLATRAFRRAPGTEGTRGVEP